MRIHTLAIAAFTLALLPTASATPAMAAGSPHSAVKVCADAVPGAARCLSQRRTDPDATARTPARGRRPSPAAGAIGTNGAYDPSYLQSAYNLSSAAASGGSGATVAIVDAYDSPTAESDMDLYRSNFALPACPAGTCFRKVDQNGGTSYPAVNTGWAQEISLDVDMVSAICPNCNILLVEAASNYFSDLGTAVNTAARLGATSISNSYGGSEFSGEGNDDSLYYNHPGIAVTASSGDNGYGVEYPAASPYVTAVGGTSLNQATNTGARNATETAWSGAGSGCSAYENKPSWQTDTGCPRRTIADVSAVADPNTGVWVYYRGSWYVFGGTSVASPIIASVYALNGRQAVNGASAAYASRSALNDVVSGSNGSCGGSYLCTAGAGFDGPTGLGTPSGTAAFAAAAPVPDFTVAVTPSAQSATTGSSVNYTVTLTPSGGFTGSVNLAVSGQPADSSPTFSVNPVNVGSSNASSSVLTLSTATAGTYTLSITASSGAISHQTTATLTATAPSADFALSVSPPSQTIAAGQSAAFLVNISDLNGFAGPVNLSVAGLPRRASASFSPNPASSSSTLTIASTWKTGRGTYVLTITAVGGGVTHTTTAQLVIQ